MLSRQRAHQRSVMEYVRGVALAALAAGWPEAALAPVLGVDRLTVRRWAGKTN